MKLVKPQPAGRWFQDFSSLFPCSLHLPCVLNDNLWEVCVRPIIEMEIRSVLRTVSR